MCGHTLAGACWIILSGPVVTGERHQMWLFFILNLRGKGIHEVENELWENNIDTGKDLVCTGLILRILDGKECQKSR